MFGPLISWWTRNSVAANLLMIAILIAGFVAYLQIERELEPSVRLPIGQVSVAWPGASPQDVEEQIVVRIEEAVSEIEGIDRLWAVANEGVANVYLIARTDVDTQRFFNDVRAQVEGISTFPDAAEQPLIQQFQNRDEIMRIAVSGDVDERVLTRTADRVRREVALLAGVSVVELFGDRSEEVSIEVSEDALRRYGLDFDDVANAVRGTSVNLSSGSIRTELGDVPLAARNLADTASDFENIVVRQTSSGATIRVGDVAEVRDGFEEVNLLATVNGEPAILVQVMSGDNMDLPRTSRAVRAYLETARGEMPEGISLTLWEDSSEQYTDRMSTILWNGLSGLALVMLMLVLFLRPIVAFWVSIGIAIAFAGGLAMLPLFGVSFNMISTFAFLLVIGVIVDDAIIVGEAIHSQTERGEEGLTAAVAGTQLVLKPVIFAVLTTMIFFAPWMFISGVTSEFTKAISLVVIWCLFFSLIEALFILPAHLGHLKPAPEPRGFMKLQRGLANSIVWFGHHVYRPLISAAVRRRYLTASIFVSSMIFSIGLASTGWVAFSFMPEIQSDQVEINVRLPQGTPYTRSLAVLAQIQDAEEELENEANASGETIVENWYTRVRENDILALVRLTPPEDRTATAEEIANRLRELIGVVPDAEDMSVNYTINDSDPALQFVLHAEDLDELRLAADDIKDRLRQFEGIYSVVDDIESSTEEINFDLTPDAETLGVTLASVARQVRQGFYGEEVQRLPRNGEDVRVFVRYPREDRTSLDFLRQMRIHTDDGRQVPLSAVAELEYAPGINFILRRERQRAVIVSAEAPPELIGEIRSELSENFWDDFDARHPTVTRGSIGRAEGEAEFMAEFFTLSLIALGVAYILVAISFSSYSQPMLILFAAIPFCAMGAILGHLFMGMTMSLFSILGIVAAAGVAVNDNLVLIDYVNRLRAQGMGGAKALVEAGTARFRPILLTSLTTFVGLLPLMMERSIQAAFLIPVGVGLAFGVICALFVTLFFVPALYGIGADIQRHVVGAWTGRKRARFGLSLDGDDEEEDAVDALTGAGERPSPAE